MFIFQVFVVEKRFVFTASVTWFKPNCQAPRPRGNITNLFLRAPWAALQKSEFEFLFMYVAAARRSECHRESPPPRGYSGSLIVALFWFTASPPRCPVCTRPEDKVFFFKKNRFGLMAYARSVAVTRVTALFKSFSRYMFRGLCRFRYN